MSASQRPTIAAIVPMRHGSERVPGKNHRAFAGRPLYHRVVEALLAVPEIADVVIDTDSPPILEDARRCFPEATVIERPAHLGEGTVPMNEVLLNTVRRLDHDLFLQTHSTNPLLRAQTVSAAIQAFLAGRGMYDSLFTVTRLQTRLWDATTRPVNHNPAILLRTQDLPPIYEENSCVYLFDRDTLERRKNRLGERPLMYEIDPLEAVDIDEEFDFQLAEFIWLAQEREER